MYVFEEDLAPPKFNSAPPEEPEAKRPRRSSGIKLVTNKYNLFSIIDEPINNCLSGQACTCPANELVASNRNQAYFSVDEANQNSA